MSRISPSAHSCGWFIMCDVSEVVPPFCTPTTAKFHNGLTLPQPTWFACLERRAKENTAAPRTVADNRVVEEGRAAVAAASLFGGCAASLCDCQPPGLLALRDDDLKTERLLWILLCGSMQGGGCSLLQGRAESRMALPQQLALPPGRRAHPCPPQLPHAVGQQAAVPGASTPSAPQDRLLAWLW